MFRNAYIVIGGALLFASASIFAQDAAPTRVGGDATALGVVVGNQTSVAIGDNATAIAEAGVISDANVGGDATALGVVVGNQTAVAIGKDTTACSRVGVIGGGNCGR